MKKYIIIAIVTWILMLTTTLLLFNFAVKQTEKIKELSSLQENQEVLIDITFTNGKHDYITLNQLAYAVNNRLTGKIKSVNHYIISNNVESE